MSNENEIDKWFDELRTRAAQANKPNELQMQKWQRAVRKELKDKFNWSTIAASLIGFALGALVFGSNSNSHSKKQAENNFDNATVEYVTIKTD
jgi:hypothetical protein